MPTPKKGPRLGGSPSHQKAILANLATNLFEHGKITTTEAKARVLRPYAERLITKAKRGDLHNRRQVMSVIRDKTVVHVLFTELGPRYADRPGGYTRITKIGPRKGDNAPMAMIELVEAEFTPKVRSTRSSTATATGKSRDAASAPAEPATDESAGDVADGPEVEVADVTDSSEGEATESSAGDDAAATGDETPDSGALEAETEQVGAQEAAAQQEPRGETVGEFDESAEADKNADGK